MHPLPTPSPEPPDPWGPLRRRWWLIMLTGLLGLAGAAGWLRGQEPVWESSTTLLIHPNESATADSPAPTPVNAQTEARLVRSTAVAARAAQRLGTSLSPEELATQVRVEALPDTAILQITFAAAYPEAARRGAVAFAEAYLTHREEEAHADLLAEREAIEERVETLDEALTELTGQLAFTPPGSAPAAELEHRRTTVTHQLDTLVGRLDTLSTTVFRAGTVITEPRGATERRWPPPVMVLASGGSLGLVIGAATAIIADRLSRRIRRPADVPRLARLRVLAVAGPGLPPAGSTLTPNEPGGRVFDRLRNELLAALDGAGQVVMVAGVSRGEAAATVAHHLAVSLSRAGEDVILLGSAAPRTASGPGLSGVLDGRAPVREALRRHPSSPRLRCLTMDPPTLTGGQLQSPAMRRVLAALTRRSGYVVVEAPPTGASADAQSLAGRADATLLVVELGRTRAAEIADAVEQLRRVGSAPLGAVVVPPHRRQPRTPERAPTSPAAPASVPSQPDPSTDSPRPTRRRRIGAISTRPQSPVPARALRAAAARQPRSDEETVALPRLTPALLQAIGAERRPDPTPAHRLTRGGDSCASNPRRG